ncbi:hypothetical protein [Tenacibaculum sp. 190524A05c]|uniref:hypothetical protein n=1 Tax=Tenacibaculum platacis TaxID=3137852 RepID=UPI0031FAA99E
MRHLFLLFILSAININTSFAQENDKKIAQDFAVIISRIEGQEPISLKEWLNYTKLDYKLKASSEANKSSDVADNELTFFSETNGKKVMFQFNKGTISTQNPSKETLFKMFLISKRLSATLKSNTGKVFSDDDFYKQ